MQGNPQQDVLNATLIEAVKARSLDRVRELLIAGADPSHCGKACGETPLHHAAMLGFEEIAEALLAAGADPDRFDLNGEYPLVVATLAGHDALARLIRDWSSRRRADRTQKQLDRLGWSIVNVREDEVEFMIAGTEKVDEPNKIIELSLAKEPFRMYVPFTSFEGWVKQIVVEASPAIAQEAVQAGLPWFFDLTGPREEMLKAIPKQRAGNPRRFTGTRPRRFAGDSTLPRSRYYTLSKNETGDDGGTLVCEMYAYSHIARTGKMDLIDMADPTAPERLVDLGLQIPAINSILLVFLPGPKSGLSPFLLHAGLPQRVVAFPLPVRVIYERIDKVVDLRIPDTADWFARVVSQCVLEVRSPQTDKISYFKCWPRRPPLDNLGQLLPEMLTQELGGGVLSVVAGALLRKAGANALVFPSARNDPFLVIEDGAPRRAEGWNLVDYRQAPPPKQLIVLNADRSWPTNVRLGPGFDIRDGPAPDLFKTVTIEYENSGPRRGSFQVNGIVNVLAILRELELQSFRNNEAAQPWWLM